VPTARRQGDPSGPTVSNRRDRHRGPVQCHQIHASRAVLFHTAATGVACA
jgi:hypothetical protein